MKLLVVLLLVLGVANLIRSDAVLESVEQEDDYAGLIDTRVISSNPSISVVNSSKLSDYVQNAYAKYPRYDLKGKAVDHTFNITNEVYLQSVALTGTPFVAIIAVTCLILLVASIWIGAVFIIKAIVRHKRRRWSKRMGLKGQYKNLGGSPWHIKARLQKNEALAYNLTTLACLVIFLGLIFFLVTAIFVNKDLDNAVLLSVDNLAVNLHNRVFVEDRIIEESKKLKYYDHFPSDAIEIITRMRQLNEYAGGIQDQVHRYEKIRYNYVLYTLVTTIVISVIGIFSTFFRFKFSIIMFIIVGLLCSIFIWVVPGSHLPGGVLIADVCPQLDTLIQKSLPLDEEDQAYVNFFVNCTNPNQFDIIDFLLNSSIDSKTQQLNYAIQHHFNNNTINAYRENLDELLELKYYSDDFLNCTISSNIFKSTQNMLCIDILNSSFMLMIIFTIIGALLLLSIISFLFIYCTSSVNHRYNHLYQSISKIDSGATSDELRYIMKLNRENEMAFDELITPLLINEPTGNDY